MPSLLLSLDLFDYRFKELLVDNSDPSLICYEFGFELNSTSLIDI